MSKRNSDGEVLANQFAVRLAQQQQRYANLLGESPPGVEESHDERPAGVEQTSGGLADLKGDADDEGYVSWFYSIMYVYHQANSRYRFGIGAIIPKEIQDGSFTNRIPTSHERLLENLIGKKAAKAHLASQKKHATTTKPPKPVKPVETKEESDEEEGRAATFKSKRQRRTRPVRSQNEESDDEDEESRTLNLASREKKTAADVHEVADEGGDPIKPPEDDGASQVSPAPRPSKSKPKSFLDEILSEKSKKKNKKKKVKAM